MKNVTANKAIEAYGGEKLWKKSKYIEAEVSVKGLAFILKRRPFLKYAKIKMEIGRPFSKLTSIGEKINISGILEGHNVRLENEHGDIIEERVNARKAFPYGRRTFYWDDLDMAYFANYAFWNYFTLPSLLMNNELEWKETSEGVLKVLFPNTIPTHNNEQEFHFDKETGLLVQHNYTADIISKLAKAANVVAEHSEQNGILFPSSRCVTPRTKKGVALKRPLLVDIQVHQFKLSG